VYGKHHSISEGSSARALTTDRSIANALSLCFFHAGFEANPTLQQCFKNFCVYGKNHGISQGSSAGALTRD
jgi:hypothetical protein